MSAKQRAKAQDVAWLMKVTRKYEKDPATLFEKLEKKYLATCHAPPQQRALSTD